VVLITRVASAKKGTRSLKTTVPEGIAEFLELSDKDELEWKMEIQNQERIVLLKRNTNTDKSLHTVTKTALKCSKHKSM
jgi:hypothetical protein